MSDVILANRFDEDVLGDVAEKVYTQGLNEVRARDLSPWPGALRVTP